MAGDWIGEHPLYLMIRHAQVSDGKMVGTVIDLDEGGWKEKHAEVLALPGRWYLVNKETQTMPLAQIVNKGETGIYRARHVGLGSGDGDNVIQYETVAYGIGKRYPDGKEHMLWFFGQGLVCMDEDVNPIGTEVVKVMNSLALMQRAEASKIS